MTQAPAPANARRSGSTLRTPQQASRASDYTAFMYLGELIEYGATEKIFTAPDNKRTEQYITGRFG